MRAVLETLHGKYYTKLARRPAQRRARAWPGHGPRPTLAAPGARVGRGRRDTRPGRAAEGAAGARPVRERNEPRYVQLVALRGGGAISRMLEKFDGKDKRMLAGETNEPRYVQLVALRGGGAISRMLEKFDGKDKRMFAGEMNEPRYVQLVALHGGGASTGMLDGKNKRMLEKFHFKFLALALAGSATCWASGPGAGARRSWREPRRVLPRALDSDAARTAGALQSKNRHVYVVSTIVEHTKSIQ